MGINQGGPVSNVKRTLTVDSETLDIDEINNRVGIGTTAPGTTLQLEDTAPYITIKNTTAENTSGGCESKLIFEDHGNNALGQIEVSHAGSSDDEKGQLIIKTNNDSGLQTAVTIDEAQDATFASNVKVVGDIIIDDGGSLKEAGGTAALTFDGSGNVTKIGQDSMSSGDVLTWDGAKFVGEAPTVGDITGVTAGVGLSGGGATGAVTLTLDLSELSAVTPTVTDSFATLDSDGANEQLTTITALSTLQAGTASATGLSASSGVLSVSDLHPVGVDGSANQMLTDDGDGTVTSESNLSFDGSTLAVTGAVTTTTTATVGTDLTVTGGDITYGNGQNATLFVAAVAGTNTAGKDLTISAGQGTGSGVGGNIYFKTSDGAGSGTTPNTPATAMRIFDNLAVSIFGNLLLDSDGAKLMFGADSEIVLEHDHNQGLKIASNIGDPAPRFTLESNNADAQGPQLFFLKDGASPANADEVGEIVFSSEGDDAGGHTFGRMRCIIDDVGAGSESSSLLFSVAEYDGAETTGLTITGSASVNGAVDVTIGADIGSTATVAGDLAVGDDLSLTTDASVINMGAGNDFTITHDGTTGATIAGNPVHITSAGQPVWKATSHHLTIANEASNRAIKMKLGSTDANTDFRVMDSGSNSKFKIKGDGEVQVLSNTAVATGGGFDGAAGITMYVAKVNGITETTILLDINDLFVSGSVKDVIGEDGVAAAYITQLTDAINGVIFYAEMMCILAPAGSNTTADIDLVTSSNSLAEDAEYDSGSAQVVFINANGDWAAGVKKNSDLGSALAANNHYLYLANGSGANSGGEYTAGKFVIKLFGANF